MIRRYVYPLSVVLLVCWASSIHADEQTSAEESAAATETSTAEAGDRDDRSDWFRMFGYPNFDEAEELARVTGKPMMIVFR